MTISTTKLMSKTYLLTITEEQAKVFQTATELLARIQSGQIREAMEHLPLRDDMDWGIYHEIRDNLTQQMPLILKDGIDGWSSSFGVGSKHLPPSHDIAWDLYCVIRHRLSWDSAKDKGLVESDAQENRNWSTMMGVNYDQPFHWGTEPLASMVRIK